MEATVVKYRCKEWDSVPILCVNVNIAIDTVLKFDANGDASVGAYAKSERTFWLVSTPTSECHGT